MTLFYSIENSFQSRQAWCDAIQVDVTTITRKHVICDAHFPDEMFTISINKQLNNGAVPKTIKDEPEEAMMEVYHNGNGEEYLDEFYEGGNVQHLEIDSIEPHDYFPCDICDSVFPTREERNDHIDDHFKMHKCTACGKSFEGLRKFEHHRRNQSCTRTNPHTEYITYECFACHQANFFSMRSLRIHYNRFHKLDKSKPRRSDVDNEINRCRICNKTFANVYIMRTHQTEVHARANSFGCDVCGKKFNRASNLQWHRLIHDNLLPCTCKICGKSFRTISGLNLHKRTHTGEKPYNCDICNQKSYAYNTDLKRHKRSAHGIIDKKFPCSICQQIFYEPKFLRKHMEKVHK